MHFLLLNVPTWKTWWLIALQQSSPSRNYVSNCVRMYLPRSHRTTLATTRYSILIRHFSYFSPKSAFGAKRTIVPFTQRYKDGQHSRRKYYPSSAPLAFLAIFVKHLYPHVSIIGGLSLFNDSELSVQCPDSVSRLSRLAHNISYCRGLVSRRTDALIFKRLSLFLHFDAPSVLRTRVENAENFGRLSVASWRTFYSSGSYSIVGACITPQRFHPLFFLHRDFAQFNRSAIFGMTEYRRCPNLCCPQRFLQHALVVELKIFSWLEIIPKVGRKRNAWSSHLTT